MNFFQLTPLHDALVAGGSEKDEERGDPCSRHISSVGSANSELGRSYQQRGV